MTEPFSTEVLQSAMKVGGIGFAALVLVGGLFGWFLKGVLAEQRAMREELHNMNLLLLAQILQKQMGQKEVAESILERLQTRMKTQ